jgi:hypothetical protein
MTYEELSSTCQRLRRERDEARTEVERVRSNATVIETKLRNTIVALRAEVERLRGLLSECEGWLPHAYDDDPPSYPKETRWAATARRNAEMCIDLAQRIRAALTEGDGGES